ncbi:C-type cytochrome [Sulfidibacter corallicola]|uniref:C-type cytochrome n=1 Tax=Sulfidibacter corallicola TaxID=2818388 RepID=A0A8A4TEW6_SULCO|nr:c-type cytochrome [Sulfidibacter corallicola]QTD48496.1 c-type cytochrome [Sulfidibacter corallicola]
MNGPTRVRPFVSSAQAGKARRGPFRSICRLSCALILLLVSGWTSSLFAADGKVVYDKYCTQCHGDQGDGRGYAADFVIPKPRDFTTGVFKFRSTGSEYLPTREDLVRVVRDGIPGTSMPAFSHIGQAEIDAVVDYLPSFYQDRLERDKEDGFWPPKVIEMGAPPKVTDALIAEGMQVYLSSGCGDCHGHDGRADGPSAPGLEDDLGDPIKAANLAQSWRFRSGNSLSDIYKAFTTGISGTPMASFADSLKPDQRWALAAYVQSLSTLAEPEPSSILIAGRVEGDLPESLDDPRWADAQTAYFPLTAQVMWEPININPTVLGVHVRGLHNDSELTLLLEWDDPSYSLATEEEEESEEDDFFDDEEETVVALDDGFAIQFPAGEVQSNQRPYFVMGESASPANLWRWRNHDGIARSDEKSPREGDWQNYFVAYEGSPLLANQLAKGREQTSEITESGLSGTIRYRNGTYTLLISRDLKTTSGDVMLDVGTFIPIAFWAWDGHNEEEGAKGSLSAWYYLQLEEPPDSSVYLKSAGAALLLVVLQFMAMISARKKHRGGLS